MERQFSLSQPNLEELSLNASRSHCEDMLYARILDCSKKPRVYLRIPDVNRIHGLCAPCRSGRVIGQDVSDVD
jgi:hypothetical protein